MALRPMATAGGRGRLGAGGAGGGRVPPRARATPRRHRPGRRGRLSALSLYKSVFYGASVWARRALNRQKWRFSARAGRGHQAHQRPARQQHQPPQRRAPRPRLPPRALVARRAHLADARSTRAQTCGCRWRRTRAGCRQTALQIIPICGEEPRAPQFLLTKLLRYVPVTA